jgi:hypothetical protein
MDFERLVAEVEASYERYEQLATLLSRRIQQIDGWLTRIRAKEDSICPAVSKPTEGETPLCLMLGVRNAGKCSALMYAWGKSLDDLPTNWSALSGASIEIKQRAVRLIPDLLDNMRGAQEERVFELLETHAELDKIAKAIPSATEGN